MAFPTIPTVAAGRVLVVNQADTSATRTFPNLSDLTKNPGDLIVAIIIAYQSSTTDAQFSSWGASLSEIHDTGTSTTLAVGVATKVSSGSETGTFTVTQNGTITGHASMILLSIPGAHASTVPEAGSRVSGTSAAADPGSFNPAGWGSEDTLWISVVGSGMTSGTGSWTGTGTTAPANYTDRVDTNTTDNSVVGQTEAAVAFRQLAAASEDVGTAGVDTSNARNAAVVIAVRPAAATNANAENAAATVTSETPTISVATNAESVAVAVSAGVVAASVAPSAGEAAVSAIAFDATVETIEGGTNAQAECATAVAAAQDPSAAIEAPAGGVATSGAAEAATAAVSPAAESTEVGATAGSPAASVGANAEPATASAAAEIAAGAASANVGVAAVTASALDATVDAAGSSTNAQAGCAEAIGGAELASVTLFVFGEVADSTAATDAAAVTLGVAAEVASVAGAASNPATQINAGAGCATATVTVYDPQISTTGAVAVALHPDVSYARPGTVLCRRQQNPTAGHRRPSTILAGPGPAVSYRRADILVAG